MIISATSYAADISGHLSGEQQKRANALYEIIRCPVCAGQSLAGSESSIAQDLRHIIDTKIQNNISDTDIKHDLVNMYGQDILFEPPNNNKTFLLNYGVWILMLIIMSVFLCRHYYNHKMVRDQNTNRQNND